jgi:hypothetical protein
MSDHLEGFFPHVNSHAEITDDLRAVQEALEDILAGDRGIMFEEVDKQFRKKHGLPSCHDE